MHSVQRVHPHAIISRRHATSSRPACRSNSRAHAHWLSAAAVAQSAAHGCSQRRPRQKPTARWPLSYTQCSATRARRCAGRFAHRRAEFSQLDLQAVTRRLPRRVMGALAAATLALRLRTGRAQCRDARRCAPWHRAQHCDLPSRRRRTRRWHQRAAVDVLPCAAMGDGGVAPSPTTDGHVAAAIADFAAIDGLGDALDGTAPAPLQGLTLPSSAPLPSAVQALAALPPSVQAQAQARRARRRATHRCTRQTTARCSWCSSAPSRPRRRSSAPSRPTRPTTARCLRRSSAPTRHPRRRRRACRAWRRAARRRARHNVQRCDLRRRRRRTRRRPRRATVDVLACAAMGS